MWGFKGDGRGPSSKGGTFRTRQFIYEIDGSLASRNDVGVSSAGPFARRAEVAGVSFQVLAKGPGGRVFSAGAARSGPVEIYRATTHATAEASPLTCPPHSRSRPEAGSSAAPSPAPRAAKMPAPSIPCARKIAPTPASTGAGIPHARSSSSDAPATPAAVRIPTPADAADSAPHATGLRSTHSRAPELRDLFPRPARTAMQRNSTDQAFPSTTESSFGFSTRRPLSPSHLPMVDPRSPTRCMMGHDDDPEVRRRFRTWFARVLLEHLERA